MVRPLFSYDIQKIRKNMAAWLVHCTGPPVAHAYPCVLYIFICFCHLTPCSRQPEHIQRLIPCKTYKLKTYLHTHIRARTHLSICHMGIPERYSVDIALNNNPEQATCQNILPVQTDRYISGIWAKKNPTN